MRLTRRRFITAMLALAATPALPALSGPPRTLLDQRSTRPVSGGLRIVGEANRVMLG